MNCSLQHHTLDFTDLVHRLSRLAEIFREVARKVRVVLLGLALLGIAGTAQAHKPSDAYLTLEYRTNAIHGQWDLALRDLDEAVGLDANEDGDITWGEVLQAKASIFGYVRERLILASADTNNLTAWKISPTELLIDRHSDGVYAVARFEVSVPDRADAVKVRYSACFDFDPTHRGLLRLVHSGGETIGVFSPNTPERTFQMGRSTGSHSGSFVHEGVWHIWSGYDHILFLLALLLPRVLRRTRDGWVPVGELRSIWPGILKIVSAFTVAHSITLALAATGVVLLPSRLVESVIALSVVLAAINNLYPMWQERGWMVAFGFGLIHGFGFAGALTDLGLQSGGLAWPLIGFNAGVELGQLAIVSVFLPVAFWMRSGWFYPRVALQGGSVAIALLATAWTIQRVFELQWIPG